MKLTFKVVKSTTVISLVRFGAATSSVAGSNVMFKVELELEGTMKKYLRTDFQEALNGSRAKHSRQFK